MIIDPGAGAVIIGIVAIFVLFASIYDIYTTAKREDIDKSQMAGDIAWDLFKIVMILLFAGLFIWAGYTDKNRRN